MDPRQKRRIAAITAFCAIIAIVIGSWACKDDVSGAGAGDIVFPATNIKYGTQVEPLFVARCGGQSSICHGADTYNDFGGFALDTYQHLRNRIEMVIPCYPGQPCNPEQSLLVRRIEGLDNPDLKMPPSGNTQLTTNQINGIKQWIREGAQNN